MITPHLFTLFTRPLTLLNCQKVSSFVTFTCSLCLISPFLTPQTLFSTLRQFVANVLLFFYHSMSYWCIFSDPSCLDPPCLVIIRFMQWLVNLWFVSLQFLTFKPVTILILDHACISYAALSPPLATLEEALHKACTQYDNSHSHDAVIKHITVSARQYSISQLTKFILRHRLS